LGGKASHAACPIWRMCRLKPTVSPRIAIDVVTLDEVIKLVGGSPDKRYETFATLARPDFSNGIGTVAGKGGNHLPICPAGSTITHACCFEDDHATTAARKLQCRCKAGYATTHDHHISLVFAFQRSGFEGFLRQ